MKTMKWNTVLLAKTPLRAFSEEELQASLCKEMAVFGKVQIVIVEGMPLQVQTVRRMKKKFPQESKHVYEDLFEWESGTIIKLYIESDKTEKEILQELSGTYLRCGSDTTLGFGELTLEEYTGTSGEPLEILYEPKNMVYFEVEGSFENGFTTGQIRNTREKEIINIAKEGKNSNIQLPEIIDARIPASSLKGVFRTRCSQIIKTAGLNMEIINTLFGNKELDVRGRLIFHDAEINNYSIHDSMRLHIDKFTGGVFDGSMQTYASVFGNTRIRVYYICDSDMQGYKGDQMDEFGKRLVLMVIRDLAAKRINVGGGFALGKGYMNVEKVKVIDSCLNQSLELNMKEKMVTGSLDWAVR